jgi:hypothetical protein
MQDGGIDDGRWFPLCSRGETLQNPRYGLLELEFCLLLEALTPTDLMENVVKMPERKIRRRKV